MRRRVRGILMSGRQFSLDSRMDLAIQGIEPSKVSNGEKQQAIEESDEQNWEGTKVRYCSSRKWFHKISYSNI